MAKKFKPPSNYEDENDRENDYNINNSDCFISRIKEKTFIIFLWVKIISGINIVLFPYIVLSFCSFCIFYEYYNMWRILFCGMYIELKHKKRWIILFFSFSVVLKLIHFDINNSIAGSEQALIGFVISDLLFCYYNLKFIFILRFAICLLLLLSIIKNIFLFAIISGSIIGILKNTLLFSTRRRYILGKFI